MDPTENGGVEDAATWSVPKPVTGGYVTLLFATSFNSGAPDFMARFHRHLEEWVRDVQPADAPPEDAAVDERQFAVTFGLSLAPKVLGTDAGINFPSEHQLLGQPLTGLPTVRVRLGFGAAAPPQIQWPLLADCAATLVGKLHDLLPEATVVLGSMSSVLSVRDFGKLRELLGQ